MKITGLLLAGGHSRRMGQDKRLLFFLGRPLIQRAFEAAQAISDEVWVLITHPEDERILAPLLNGNFLVDEHAGSGPLGALAGALPHVQSDYVLLLAIDYPLVTGPFLQKMKSALETQVTLPDAFVPLWQGIPQVTCAFYRRSLKRELKEAFLKGERSLRRWVLSLRSGRVHWLHEEAWRLWGYPEAFLNINTTQDYERLRQWIGSPFEN